MGCEIFIQTVYLVPENGNKNQKNVIKWLSAEAQKCQMGVEKVVNDQVSCSSIASTINSGGNPAGSTVLAIERALKGKYKNPYGANYAGFGDEGVKEGGWGNERDLGYVLLNAGGDTGFFRVSVSVCYQLPCSGDKWGNPGPNVVVDILKWYPHNYYGVEKPTYRTKHNSLSKPIQKG